MDITSVELAASGRYVNLGSPAGLDNLAAMTVLSYVRPSSAGESNLGYLFSKCPADGKGPRFYMGTTGKLNFGSQTVANVLLPQRTTSNSRTPYAAWQHLAVTHAAVDHLATRIKLYYETAGALVEETTYTTSTDGSGALIDNSALDVFLMNRTGLGRAFLGDIAYTAVWDRVLTLAELNTASTNGPLDVPDGLILLWSNQQDLSASAITPVARSTFVAGSLPPNLSLGGSTASANLIIADSDSAHSADGAIVLVASEAGATVLTIADSSSAHVADNLGLGVSESLTLTVADATHTDTADNVTLEAVGGEVTITSPAERGTLLMSACSVTPNGLTPTITLRSRWAGDLNASGARAMYGRVTGVAGMTPAFRLSRTQFEGTISTGKKFVFSYDKVTWTEFTARTNDASYFYFSHNAAFTGDEVYVCSQVPWLNEQTLPWIQSMESSGYVSEAASSAGAGYVFETRSATVNELAEPIAALPLYSFKVGTPGNAPDGSPKRKVVLLGGTHAAEDIGNHALRGAVEFLVSADAQAAIMRSWFDVYVYPMVAAAGRQGGAQRSDFQTGYMTADVNRKWNTAHFETVNKHQAAIQLDCGDTLAAMLDYHGTHISSAHHFVEVGADKATWQAAIQVYRPTLTMTDTSVAGMTSNWSLNVKGAPFSIIPEYHFYASSTYADVLDFGADSMRALSDIAAADYFAVATSNFDVLVQDAIHAHASESVDLSSVTGLIVTNGSHASASNHKIVARPDGDILVGTAISSLGGSLFEAINETLPDTGSYITNIGMGDGAKVALSDIADPEISTGHKVSFRAEATDGWMTIGLSQGATLIATFNYFGTFSTTPTTATRTLTTAQANAITDYSALSLNFYANPTSKVYWAEFSVDKSVDLIMDTSLLVADGAHDSTAKYIDNAYPDFDHIQGTWTASSGLDLFAMLNEVMADDTSYIQNTANGDNCGLSLSGMVDPGTNFGHKLVVRAKASSGAGILNYAIYSSKAAFDSGAAPIRSTYISSILADFTTQVIVIPVAQAALITDYNDLFITFNALNAGTLTISQLYVYINSDPSLSSQNALITAAAEHNHSAESALFTTADYLEIADADSTSEVAAPVLNLTGMVELVVADAISTHSAEIAELFIGTALDIASTVLEHSADGVVLDISGEVSLQILDVIHAHTAESDLALSSAVSLDILNAMSLHISDNVAVTSWGGLLTTRRVCYVQQEQRTYVVSPD